MSLWSLTTSTPPFKLLEMENSLQQYLLHASISGPPSIPFFSQLKLTISTKNINHKRMTNGCPLILCCSDSTSSTSSSSSSSSAVVMSTSTAAPSPPVIRKRTRYRRQYPGESEGITEEMRFVAMRLRNVNGKRISNDGKSNKENAHQTLEKDDEGGGEKGENGDEETWKPSMEGFLEYLVDSKLVFNTVERIVDESSDVAYAYFRKTGLERSEGLSKDLEWFSQQDIVIPEPGTPGVSYAQYLEELAEKSAPLFLCHFYNIYFSHIAGGQVIARQVSEKLLEGRELEFFKWEGDAQELLKGVREKLNMLGEYWCRDEKNKCLREATKSFRFLGQMVRLIIL